MILPSWACILFRPSRGLGCVVVYIYHSVCKFCFTMLFSGTFEHNSVVRTVFVSFVFVMQFPS